MALPQNVLLDTYPDSKIIVKNNDVILVSNTFEYLPAWPIYILKNDRYVEHVSNVFNKANEFDFSGVPAGEGLRLIDFSFEKDRYQIIGEFKDTMHLNVQQGNFTVYSDDLKNWSEPEWLSDSETPKAPVENFLKCMINHESNGQYPLDSESLLSIRGDKENIILDNHTMKLQPANINDQSNVSFVGFRQTHGQTKISANFKINYDLDKNEEVGLAVRKNDTDYIKFAVYKDVVKIVQRQHDIATITHSKKHNLVAFRLSVLSDLKNQYHFLFNDEELGVIDGKYLAVCSKFGTVIGPFATSNGNPTTATVRISDLVYEIK